MITRNILERTFKIQFGNRRATCFTIDFEKRQYIIASKHLVGSIVGQSSIEIIRGGTWENLPIKLVGHADGDVDISVLAAETLISPTHSLTLPPSDPTAAGMILGQDVYFLGFPFDIVSDATLESNKNFPLPFVKKAILSQTVKGTIMLDGHNNPGFSGGPVVYYPKNDRSSDLSVAGVVYGFRHALGQVYPDQERKESPIGYYLYNTGIVHVHDICHALNLIRQNPIGIKF